MATVELTEANFDELTSGEGITLVDFWATWCPPCRQFGPVYERVSEKNTDLTFGKVDTEAQQGLAAAFQISSIPTLMVIKDKVVLFAEAGALPEAALDDLISQARSVDMAEVRARIAAEGEGAGESAAV